MADPAGAIREIAGLVDQMPDALPLRADHTALLGVNHGLMGNPSRFVTGEVELREDDAWKTSQTATSRLLVTTLTLPLLARYGYQLRPIRP